MDVQELQLQGKYLVQSLLHLVALFIQGALTQQRVAKLSCHYQSSASLVRLLAMLLRSKDFEKPTYFANAVIRSERIKWLSKRSILVV